MRNSLTLHATVIALTFTLPTSLSAKDWSSMNLNERLNWAEAYIKQTCPHKVLTSDERSRAGLIESVPQLAVKAYIRSQCPSKSAHSN